MGEEGGEGRRERGGKEERDPASLVSSPWRALRRVTGPQRGSGPGHRPTSRE